MKETQQQQQHYDRELTWEKAMQINEKECKLKEDNIVKQLQNLVGENMSVKLTFKNVQESRLWLCIARYDGLVQQQI